MSATPRIKKSMLAVALAVTPWFADAAGLGRLNVLSGLGQPLRGEIELVSVQPEEAESLAVGLASADAHAAAGFSYPSNALGVRLVLDRRASGALVVVVSSAQAVNEPILDLVVDLRWATGQIRRGYSALLDPVGYATPAPAPVAQSVAKTPQDSAPVITAPVREVSAAPLTKKPVGKPAKVQEKKPVTASSPFAEPAPAEDGSYAVKAGDTLSSIARKVRPDGVNLDQVLVGLYRNNKTAFDGNMNLLKKGKILKVPDAASLQGLDRGEAAKEVLAQARDWQSYRKQLAEAVKQAPAAQGDAASSTGKITAKVEDKGASTVDKSKDVLKLSSATGKAGLTPEQARVKALEEEVAARKKALDEANQRVSELQGNVRKMEELVALKSQTGAQLQQQAVATAIPTVVPTVMPIASAASEVQVLAASAVASEVASAPAPKPERAVAPIIEPEPEPTLLDLLMENLAVIGGGLLVVLGGVGALIWKRRQQQPGLFENSIITGGDLKPNTVIGRTGGGVISTQAENSFLTDFSRQGFGSIDTDEVDPIAEADVYMAYGRDAQAEEILKDALSKDKQRHEVRVKLLDIYAARKDKVAFEEVASELYAMTEGDGQHWAHAVHLGRSIDPDNPLYGRGGPAGSQAAAAAVIAPAAVAVAAAVSAAQVADAGDAEASLDFDLGVESLEAEEQAPLVDFELPQSVQSSAFEAELDLDLNLAPENTPMSDLSFDLGEPEQVPAQEALMSLDLPIDVEQELSAAESIMGDLDLSLSSVTAFESGAEELSAEAMVADFEASLGPDLAVNETQAAPSLDFGAAQIEPVLLDDAELDQALNLDFAFQQEEVVAAVPDFDTQSSLDDLDLGLGDAAAAADFAVDDPVQTKIDLARAYVDMGDAEGAREILQEAMQEGSPAQQEVARGMLATL